MSEATGPATVGEALGKLYELYQMRGDHEAARIYMIEAVRDDRMKQWLRSEHARVATLISARGWEACYVSSAMFKMLNELFERIEIPRVW